MKTVFDINDIWDALEARQIWSSWAEVAKDEAKLLAKKKGAHQRLQALQGGAG